MKIAVYAIALNEAQHVERWTQSCSDADVRVVCDTGSTDGTTDELYRMDFEGNAPGNVMVHRISVRPWRFDHAREAALALVPADVDVCIALDMDEELAPGWRDAMERAWKPGTTRLRHPFAFRHDADGKPSQVMYGHRIHGRHDYYWRYPIHEALSFKGTRQERIEWCDDLWIHHRPAPKPTRANYLPMLAKAAADDPACDRMAFYHARELMYVARNAEAVAEFRRYLDLPTATWDEQRAEAMRYIGRCLTAMADPMGAATWFMRAALECPRSRQAWVELAESRRAMEDWLGGAWAATQAMACEMPRGELYDVRQLTAGPYDIGGVCAYYAGLKDKAAEWLQRAAELCPGDPRINANLKFITPA